MIFQTTLQTQTSCDYIRALFSYSFDQTYCLPASRPHNYPPPKTLRPAPVMESPEKAAASGQGPESAVDVQVGENRGCSRASSPLSEPPSNLVTPVTEYHTRGGDPNQSSSTQSGHTTSIQDPLYTTSGEAAINLNDADSEEEDGPSMSRDDRRTIFDQKVQQLLIDLEDEVGVEILLNGADFDDAESLAVKIIWQQRKMDEMAQEISRLEDKIKAMSAMTLEVMEK